MPEKKLTALQTTNANHSRVRKLLAPIYKMANGGASHLERFSTPASSGPGPTKNSDFPLICSPAAFSTRRDSPFL
jgi:hypothetical protein